MGQKNVHRDADWGKKRRRVPKRGNGRLAMLTRTVENNSSREALQASCSISSAPMVSQTTGMG